MKDLGTAFGAGLLFGIGLLVSGMTDPANIIGFLDFGGRWNPQLAGVMVGAIAVHAPLLRWKRPAPVPDRLRLDLPLVGGAAIFGVGWGWIGYCPGPALVALGGGSSAAASFVVAMMAGGWLVGLLRSTRARTA